MSLHTLPYDLLFNIAQYLDVDDIHSIQACCKSLRLFTLTRPVYRALAHTLLLRSRPLPLPAFARLPDLQTPDLIRAVNRAHSFDRAWRVRPPRPASKNWYTIISAPPGEEIDWLSPITSSYTLCATKSGKVVCWDVERDLCLAEWDPRQLELKPTEKGTPGREWELWKCRVEFDEKAVYFTMARVIKKLYDDNRVMEFVLMKLAFPPEDPIPPPTSAMSPIVMSLPLSPQSTTTQVPTTPAMIPIPMSPTSPQGSLPPSSSPSSSPSEQDGDEASLAEKMIVEPSIEACGPDITGVPLTQPNPPAVPHFFPLTTFHTRGVVMNVFLLDPPRRLLSAFVWVASSNTIGLYVLLDWDKDEYVFIDTGVECLISSNWSCILHDDQIVIHSEETDAAFQHFYPLDMLRKFIRPRRNTEPSKGHRRRSSESTGGSGNGENEAEGSVDTSGSDDTTLGSNGIAGIGKGREKEGLPTIIAALSPVKSISKKFVFPPSATAGSVPNATAVPTAGNEAPVNSAGDSSQNLVIGGPSMGLIGSINSESSSGSQQPLDAAPSGPSETKGEVDDEHGSGSETDSEEGPVDVKIPNRKGREKTSAARRDRRKRAPGNRKGKMRAQEAEEENDEEQSDEYESEREETALLVDVDRDSEMPIFTEETVAASSSGVDPPSILPSEPPIPPNTSAPVPTPEPNPNPYPFPPWYPESAHFVRQWWPTLHGVPRLSCTVVLLAAHDPDTHRTRFVLAQHYFRVPIVRDEPVSILTGSTSETADASPGGRSSTSKADDDEMLHLWYVSTPFEVVCVLDGPADTDDDEEEGGDRPRPLVAVDFGHAVWIEYQGDPGGVYGVDASRLILPLDDDEEEALAEMEGDAVIVSWSATQADDDAPADGEGDENAPGGANVNTGTISDPQRHRVPKCLRFVTFPPVGGNSGGTRQAAIVRTLEVPEELDLNTVETINIDQSQGAVILSVKEGKIFILRYE